MKRFFFYFIFFFFFFNIEGKTYERLDKSITVNSLIKKSYKIISVNTAVAPEGIAYTLMKNDGLDVITCVVRNPLGGKLAIKTVCFRP